MQLGLAGHPVQQCGALLLRGVHRGCGPSDVLLVAPDGLAPGDIGISGPTANDVRVACPHCYRRGVSVRPKKKCCQDKPRCKRCPIRLLAEGRLDPADARALFANARNQKALKKAKLQKVAAKLEDAA